MTTQMARNAVRSFLTSGPIRHAGLLLDRGLVEWPADKSKKGKAFVALLQRSVALPVPEIYNLAYGRWRKLVCENLDRFSPWYGSLGLDGRMFIGLGALTPIETAATVHHSYGVPYIPGSAVKGIARSFAVAENVAEENLEILFGRDPGPSEDGGWDAGDAGYVIFHDAWWVPGSTNSPFVREIDTVHHPEYYRTKGGTDATDFDSPTPNPQIAVRGGFLFAVEAPAGWGAYALQLLVEALKTEGCGGRTGSGYGYFESDDARNEEVEQTQIASLSPEEGASRTVHGWNLDELAVKLGREWNETILALRISTEILRVIVRTRADIEEILGWEKSHERNKKKTFNKLFKNNDQ